LTIGFARRAATYKRAQLIFRDTERLIELGAGKIQLIFSGKAHPNDKEGKELIYGIIKNARDFEDKIKIIYLENYNMWLGKLITAGVDVWLNTPLRPNEASGTSGMKSALNGIPNLSILDGWWEEGCNNKANGWSIGTSDNADDESDANSLYDLLEKEVIPSFYMDEKKWISIMRNSIVTGVDFTSQRMVRDYQKLYYR
jgi:starch phosphorylase